MTAREAPGSWETYRLRPRIMRNVREISTAVTVLGHELATPVCVAPSTLQRQADDAGEAATTRAAAKAGSLACISSNSGTKFEALGALGVPWWVQAYVFRDRGLSAEMLQKARDCGAMAVALTVDTPRTGTKYNAGKAVWDIVRADDALDCVRAGASAIQVSNHGGRQLDLTVHTAHALAKAVFVGRPVLWALAAEGEPGVQRLLTDLTAELALTMKLSGAPTIADVTGDLVV